MFLPLQLYLDQFVTIAKTQNQQRIAQSISCRNATTTYKKMGFDRSKTLMGNFSESL